MLAWFVAFIVIIPVVNVIVGAWIVSVLLTYVESLFEPSWDVMLVYAQAVLGVWLLWGAIGFTIIGCTVLLVTNSLASRREKGLKS